MDGIAARVLAWAGADDDAQRRPMLRAAWIVVSLHVAIRLTLTAWFAAWRWLAPAPLLLFALGMRRRLQPLVARLLAVIECGSFALAYPDVSNHYLVESLAVLIFAAVDLEREEERELCLRGLRWLAVVVLVMSGVQKLLHGAYFHGQFLAYMVADTDRFAAFFGPFLSAADLEHLRSLRGAIDTIDFRLDQPVGALPGPYRVDSIFFVAVSNAVWIAEIALPLGLLVRRARPCALAGALALMAGIAASSRELFFDTLFVNLLLLFAGFELNRKLLPLSLAVYAIYLLGGLGVVHAEFVW